MDALPQKRDIGQTLERLQIKLGGPLLVALNLVPWSIAWWALSAAGVAFPYLACLIAIAATIGIYYCAYEGFHYLMHRPTIGWIERSRPFRFLERHHRLHHIHMGKNFNVVCPLADLSLGTLVLRDSAEPQQTSPAARNVARRHSRFGRKLREQAEERNETTVLVEADGAKRKAGNG